MTDSRSHSMKLTAGALAVLVLGLAPAFAQAAGRPDLRVTAVSPADATVSVTVHNTGRGRASRSFVRVVRSADAKRDARDTVLAKIAVRALARGKSSRVSVPVRGVGGGFLVACAD